jgi:hypothetical protein
MQRSCSEAALNKATIATGSRAAFNLTYRRVCSIVALPRYARRLQSIARGTQRNLRLQYMLRSNHNHSTLLDGPSLDATPRARAPVGCEAPTWRRAIEHLLRAFFARNTVVYLAYTCIRNIHLPCFATCLSKCRCFAPIT